MNLVKSVLPLFTLFGIDTGQETVVETVPSRPPEWLPTGQQIERVVNRIKVDGNVQIYEQEVVYVTKPERPEPYQIITVRQNHPPTPEQRQMLADWQAGRCEWVGGTRHPADIIRNGSAAVGAAQVVNGRIVLE